jgi:hypothetical protein
MTSTLLLWTWIAVSIIIFAALVALFYPAISAKLPQDKGARLTAP